MRFLIGTTLSKAILGCLPCLPWEMQPILFRPTGDCDDEADSPHKKFRNGGDFLCNYPYPAHGDIMKDILIMISIFYLILSSSYYSLRFPEVA